MKSKKIRICKGCNEIIDNPTTSLQQTHPNYKCYRLWQDSIKRSKTATMRQISGKENDRLRHKADKTYQIELIKKYPYSIISGLPTEVIHHWIYKSHSNATRYYVPNGIPVTNDEHGALHGKCPEFLQNQIIIAKGIDWLGDVQTESKKLVKLTDSYLEDVINELNKEG